MTGFLHPEASLYSAGSTGPGSIPQPAPISTDGEFATPVIFDVLLIHDSFAGETIRTIPRVPALKAIPRLSTMFTGRKDILEKLAQYLDLSISSVSLKKQRIFVLYGLGGTGKTQIMAKFVNECGDQYDDGPINGYRASC